MKIKMSLCCLMPLMLAQITVASSQESTKYPPSDPQAWEAAMRMKKEERAAMIHEVEPAVLSSFTYNLGAASPPLFEIVKVQYHLVDYEESWSDPRRAFAVFTRDPDDTERQAFLSCFRMYGKGRYEKESEIALGQSTGAQYEIELVSDDSSHSPLLHLYRDKGAALRFISHELYQFDSSGIRLLWHWTDSYQTEHSGQSPYYATRVDFSGLSTQDKSIVVYGTYRRELKGKSVIEHEMTRYVWDRTAGQYLKKDK